MKKWMKFVPVIIIAAVIVFIFLNKGLFYHIKDQIVWDAMKKSIAAENVALVALSGYNSMSFEGETKEKIIYLLKSAAFKESNWQHFGPTPDGVLTITFKDGKYIHFGYWGGGTFETASFGSQFLIVSEELGALIESHNKKN